MTQSSRPAKRRRVNGPRKPQSAPTSTASLYSTAAVPRHDADQTKNLPRESPLEPASFTPSPAGVKQIEVCPCPEGENASTSVPISSPTHADLRTLWSLQKEESQSCQEKPSLQIIEVESVEAGKDGTPVIGAENKKLLGLVHEDSEPDMDDEPPRRSPGVMMLDNPRSDVTQPDTIDIMETAVAKSTHRALTKATRVINSQAVRPAPQSNSLRTGFRTRRRPKLEYETSSSGDGQEKLGQVATTANDPKTAADLEAENSPARITPSYASPPTSAPGLHEDITQINLNRAPEISRSMNSRVSTLPTKKENAGPIRKPKRRLILHDTQPRQENKKRKAAPKQTVQTTLALAIGGNAGMRECKVCDTVYNPLHPEDVKVHAKRHAGVVRRERRSVGV